jgi:hypothetical protein
MLKNGPQVATVGAGPATVLPEGQATGEFAASAGAVVSAGPAASGGQGALLSGLKEELFALETDRLAGRLTEEQYIEQKAAMDTVLRRALGRVVTGLREGS